MRKKEKKYVRKINRKKISVASVISLVAFITGAAFFSIGMYLTTEKNVWDASVIAVLGWISLLVFILGAVVELLNLKVSNKFLIADKWAISLNMIMSFAIVLIYIWGVFF